MTEQTDSQVDFDSLDYFRGDAVVSDPYPYFDHLRSKCPVTRDSQHNVVMLTGWEEVAKVAADDENFSACVTVTGPFPGFPVPIEGISDDVTELIEQYRDQLPFSDQLPSLDAPQHTEQRALLMRLLTLRSLKENEEFLWRLADYQIDQFIDAGEVDIQTQYAGPLAMLVIADVLGVPEEDHVEFRRVLQDNKKHDPGIGSTETSLADNPLAWLYSKFAAYITDRRENPRDDVLTGLANAKYRDGSTPDVDDVCRIAANLFAAGQETTVRLISTAVKILGEDQELQQTLRDRPELVDVFVEEVLRIEGPIKGDFRLAKRTTEVGGVEIPAGATVMLTYGAANRDPRQFDDPNEFRLDRPNVRQHLTFGRGVHTCPGGPLARTEGRVAIARLLQRLGDIKISERHHGPADARRYDYAPTYILRGLNSLHIEFTKLG